jgi:glycine/D-amino acid oxidase-like deaminating enzyme/nitrite reductase/ring-hydroxylating ferredoxin subunit
MFSEHASQHMPQFPEPFWRANMELPSFPKLENDIEVDVSIVGGGIVGITAAYLLRKEGMKVALIDAGRVLTGTTGHTTAKITAQHGLIYHELIEHFGLEKARAYYEASMSALHFIHDTAARNQIECDFTHEDAYLYTNTDSYISKLEKEMKAYETLGIQGDYRDSIPIDIPVKAAVKMNAQGQFHPLKYLKKLLEECVKHGAQIFENTTAVDVDYGNEINVLTRNGHKMTCKQLVIASHYPFYDGLGFYFARMYPERSYLLAVKPQKTFSGGMYLMVEKPTRSLRYTLYNNEKILLVGGERHKTGQGISTIQHYEALQKYTEQTFGINEFLYRWSAQDWTTLDKVPFIGRITSEKPNIYVATGFRKWGMSNGTAAALLISDLILERPNPYKELFTPSRFKADPSVKTLIRENADVAGHLLKGKWEFPVRTVDDLQADEGSVIRVNGKRAGAYKDKNQNVYMVDTTCRHMGCEVEWNSGDRTWDCPCHGSRYSVTGEVLEGPAKHPLKKVEE